MSGPLGSSQWMYSSGFYPYEIEQSLRFNDDDSAYLSRTPGVAGNRKTWTWSGWVKRGNLGTQQVIFSAMNGVGTSNGAIYTNFQFNTSNQLEFIDYLGSDFGGPGVRGRRISTAVFRDPSAHYHINVVLDTTQATAADRMKVWVNGVQITSWGTSVDIPLNADGYVNAAASHALSSLVYGTRFGYFDGYMAEVNFIDGQALDPTSFGEFKSGVWIPKRYTGAYGTNGFYLSFSDSAAIGDDLSGNANDWTPSGLASTDVLLDSPTNNYAVLNPLGRRRTVTTLPTFSEGNLRVVFPNVGGNATYAISSHAVSSGKYYYEVNVVTRTTELVIGVGGQTVLDEAAGMSGYQATTGTIGGFTSNDGPGASYTSGDLIGVALDLDAGTCAFYKNGVLQATGTGFPFSPAHPFVQGNTSDVIFANFGQSPFAYTPPAGFLALNTANLPEPTISPARDDVPADYFNTVLYTGTGVDRAVGGVGFQPDFTWLKRRDNVSAHVVFDVIRGPLREVYPSATNAESVETNGLVSWNSDGFDLQNVRWNGSGDTYVAWNWKAAGAGVANTDGTISSTVSANPKAGFSIVSFTAPASAGNFTVGHGLAVAPSMVVTKRRDSASQWWVWHIGLGDNTTDYLALNTTGAETSAAGMWGAIGRTSSLLGYSDTSIATSSTQIAYCFAEVEGYSKFGSYTGNGSADGPFVWCGFRPAFVMVKRTDSTGNWVIIDDHRTGYNIDNKLLYPNLSAAESIGGVTADILSNGFKPRLAGADYNASGASHVFAAWAFNPFKYSNAR